MLLTFKIEVGPTLQKDSCRPGQAQLSHLQQSIAHTFLVEWRVSFLLQQLSKDQDPALLVGSVTMDQEGEERKWELSGTSGPSLYTLPQSPTQTAHALWGTVLGQKHEVFQSHPSACCQRAGSVQSSFTPP